VCGPLQAESISRSRYFITFIDDYSRCVSIYFIKHKTEVFEKFKLFEEVVTKECGELIMKLKTDNGGEYMSKDFQASLTSKGIEHQLTVHSLQQNGVAERLNRTLMESARAMLSHSNLPNKFWAEAVATAAYLMNRTTTSANEGQLTPFEKWYGHKPNISHLGVFGFAAYSHVPSMERRKLDKKAQRMGFIGYSKNPKGYRLIDLSTDKVVTKRDVVFNETDFRFFKATNDESGSISPELLNESEDETSEGESQPEEHHEDHNEQFDMQTSMDTLNVLTQQRWLSIVLTVCKKYLSREHLMKHSAVHMQKSGNMQLTQSTNLSLTMTLGIW